MVRTTKHASCSSTDQGGGEAARGHYLFACSVVGPSVSMPGEPVIIVGNPEHDCLSRALFYRSSKGTHFLTSLPPMIWVINQQARHWWGWVVSHQCNRSQAGKPWERWLLARRATANDALAMAVVRALPASRTTRLRCRRHPVGAGCLKRQTARRRPLHLLRRQRRDPPAPRLGWQSYWVLFVPD